MENSYQVVGETPTPAPLKSQVNAQLDVLDTSIAALEKIVDGLADRLNMVLIPDVPIPSPESNEHVDAVVPLAGDIRNHARRVTNVGAFIANLIGRLEI